MKRNSQVLIAFAALWAVMGVSCIDEISLDIENDKQFVIVDAVLTDQPGEHSISLNDSPILGVGNDNILVPISGADVRLIEEGGGSTVFIEDANEAGEYKADISLSLESRYHLEIILPNGNMIQSTQESLPPANPNIDTLDWEIIDVGTINESGNEAAREFVELYVTTTPTTEDTYLRWRVTGEYQFVEKYFGILNPRNCFVKEDVDFNNIKLQKSEDFAGGVIENFPIIRTSFNSRFHIAYLFNVFQYSIDSDEFQYWENAEKLINIDGTLFDPPPGSISGNLVNVTDPTQKVQGYFSLSRLAFKRRFAVVSRKGFFVDTDCFTRPGANNPEKCLDCTTINRSTLERPDYWRF